MQLIFMKQVLYLLIFISALSCSTKEENAMSLLDVNTAYEISKTFPVSPDKVYSALTDSSVLKKIWGVQSINVDAKVGGKTNAIYVEGNQDWSFTITYLEVVPNEKLKWLTHFKSFPSKETRVTLLFKKAEAGTELIIRMENFESKEERDANKGAWETGLKTLEGILK